MSCARARVLIDRVVDHAASLEDELWLDEHVRSCARCRAWQASVRRLEEALASIPEPARIPLDLDRSLAAVNQRIDAELVHARTRLVWRRRIAVACAVVLLLGAFDLLLRSFLAKDGVRNEVAVVERAPAPPETPAPEPAAPAPVVAAEPAPPEPPEEPLDPERLASARERVRELLSDCLGSLAPGASREAVLAGAQCIDDCARELTQARWPILRLTAAFTTDEDERVARAAVRYLGVRGDALSLERVKDVLRAPARGADGVRALGDAGERALPALAAALREPELEQLALQEIARQKTAAAVRVLEREAMRRAESRSARADARPIEPVLAALASQGAIAVASLVKLGESEALRPAVLAALATTEGAGAAIAELSRGSEARGHEAVLLAAIGLLGVREALPFVEAQCGDERVRVSALACLQKLGGRDALAAVVRASQKARAGRDALVAASCGIVATAPDTAAELAQELAAVHDADGLKALLALLLADPCPQAVPALASLCTCELLPLNERERAARRAGEVGRPEQVADLARSLQSLQAGAHRVGAVLVTSIAALGGEEAAQQAIAPLAEGRGARWSRELAARSSRAGATPQIARALKPVIQSRSSRPGGSQR
jgi:hypothetical protein